MHSWQLSLITKKSNLKWLVKCLHKEEQITSCLIIAVSFSVSPLYFLTLTTLTDSYYSKWPLNNFHTDKRTEYFILNSHSVFPGAWSSLSFQPKALCPVHLFLVEPGVNAADWTGDCWGHEWSIGIWQEVKHDPEWSEIQWCFDWL